MKLSIIGKGAVASLVAARCQEQRISHNVLPRDGQPYTLSYQLIHHKPVSYAPEIASPQSIADVLLVPTKAHQVLPALVQWQDCIHKQTAIVLLHNGMGTLEKVQAAFPQNPLVAMTTRYGALLTAPNTLRQTGHGNSAASWITRPKQEKAQRDIEALLNQLLPPCTWQENIQGLLWQKLLINAVINPLTALHKINNGQLAQAPYSEQVDRLIGELAPLLPHLPLTMSLADIAELIQSVIHNTAANFSSMYQDIHQGRGSEIHAITGYLLETAKRHNIPLPEHQRLYQQVLALEEQLP